MSTRLFRSIVRLFPAEARINQGQEMLDALAEVPSGRVVRESASLMRAAAASWVRWLRSPTSIRRSIWYGALLWLGFLVGIGPFLRLVALTMHGPRALGWTVAIEPFVAAAGALALMLVALATAPRRWSWIVALALGVTGISFAAVSIRVGEWGFGAAFPYELRWLGLGLFTAIITRPQNVPRWSGLAAATIGVLAASVVAIPHADYGRYEAAPYSYWVVLRNRGNPLDFLNASSSSVGQAIEIVLILAIVILPFFMPSLAALTVPSVIHVWAVSPSTAVGLAGYVLIVAAWHIAGRQLTVSVTGSPPAISIGWRARRLQNSRD